jgi:hypothetical protein
MLHTRTHRSLVIALYVNAAVLAAILLVLVGRGSSPAFLPAAMAQNQLPIGGGAGVFLVPAQFAPQVFGCYLMDIDAQTICVYQYLPPDNKIKLVAARSFRYDRQLGNFNIAPPAPLEVRQWVDQEKQGNRVLESNPQKPAGNAPAN